MSKLDRLKAVELHDVWPHEASDFTPWLAEEESLELLGETLGMDLELEGQEEKVGDFHADILCRNAEDGSRVLIENQLERTDHTHLGQILTYAAGLNAHTVVWIAKKFRAEHRAALDRLNEITNENFQCFGIEVKLWRIGDSARAPQFEIVSSPNDWSRAVRASKDLSERERQNIKLWTALLDSDSMKGIQLQLPKPGKWDSLGFSIGRGDFNMDAYLRTQKKEIGVRLYLSGKNAKAHFHLLQKEQTEVEQEFGEPLEWLENPENKHSRIFLRKENTDPRDETDWPNQHKWFAAKLESLDQAFRQRIKALNAADWAPPEDGDNDDD